MKKIAAPTLLTAGIVVVVLLAYAMTFVVRFSEVAVQVRLGRVQAVLSEPGLYFRWPWPIESVQKYDARPRTLDALESEIKTRDGKNVIVGCYAIWRIENPELFYRIVQKVADAERELRARINQRRAAVIGTEDLSAFVNLDGAQVQAAYDRIESAMLDGREADGGPSLRESVGTQYGIRLEKVALRRISLPEETTQSVFQQMIAERQKEAARYREEGKALAKSIEGRAEGAQNQILAFVNRLASEYRSTGIQASTRLLRQIAAGDQEFFEWLRYLDALRGALQQKSTIFLDSRSVLFEPFVGPPAQLSPATQPAGGG